MAKKHLTHEEINALPLVDQALYLEERRHRNRLDEIKRMRKAMEAIESDRAALNAEGLHLTADSMTPVYGDSMQLRLSSLYDAVEVQACLALLKCGFTVDYRDDDGSGRYAYSTPILKKGRLRVRLLSIALSALAQAERELAEHLQSEAAL
ncbi:hypothetical protein [Ralstonia sp. UBA689]|uniref:hypothetical protein n=1 Tax=Ralstonia sp. UBA689 TaxID=1947373 RepID=UPI0025D42B44|nr:hypothetical protein [Ralstonia sp. UBA689]